ncbi:MAG: hypothetical protein JKY19_10705 [Alcanivoracaceae bacterium]|nr:hypothetical protein [Alcanivoracaceae bacterium]
MISQVVIVNTSHAINLTLNGSPELELSELITYDYTENPIRLISTNTAITGAFVCLGPNPDVPGLVTPSLAFEPTDPFKVYGMVGVSSAVYHLNQNVTPSVLNLFTNSTSQCVTSGFSITDAIFANSFEAAGSSPFVLGGGANGPDLRLTMIDSLGNELQDNVTLVNNQIFSYGYRIANVGTVPLEVDMVDYYLQTQIPAGRPHLSTIASDHAWNCLPNITSTASDCGDNVSGNGVVYIENAHIEVNDFLEIKVTRKAVVPNGSGPSGLKIDLLATALITNEQDAALVDNFETLSIGVSDNNPPSFVTTVDNKTVLEDSSPSTYGFSVSDLDPDTLTVTASSSVPSIIGAVANNTGGDNWQVTVTPELNMFTTVGGPVVITLMLSDESAVVSSTFEVNVTAVNDEPSFTICGDFSHDILTGDRTCGGIPVSNNRVVFAGFVTDVNLGPNEDAQNVEMYEIVSFIDNNGIIGSFPDPDISISNFGVLNYTPSGNFGVATIQAQLKDDGGDTNGGDDLSPVVEFTFTVPGPDVALAKTVYFGSDNGASCEGGELVQAEFSNQVTYCFKVTNSGSTYLEVNALDDANVGVNLAGLTLVGSPSPFIAPGDSVVYYFVDTVEGDLLDAEAILTVNPIDEMGDDIASLSDVMTVDMASVDMIAPAVTLAKTAYAGHDSGVGCAAATDGLNIVSGTDISYCYRTENTGDTDLSIATFSDFGIGISSLTSPLIVFSGADISQPGTLLNPGATSVFYYQTTVIATPNQFANISMNPVSAAGVDIININDVFASDSAGENLGVFVEFSIDSSDIEITGGNLPQLLVLGTVTTTSTVTISDVGSGNATEGVGNDYIFASPVTVTIPVGSYDGTLATAVMITGLTILDDAIVEGSEIINFSLDSATGDAFIEDANNNASIAIIQSYTILDDDSAAVTVGDISGDEDAGGMTFVFTLDNAVAGGFTLDVNTADGSALLADSDYTQITTEQVSFLGSVGETQTVTFTPTADAVVEGDETATISMTNSSNANVAISDTATVTINNDDV